MKSNNLILIIAVSIFSLQVITFVYNKKSDELMNIQRHIAHQSLKSNLDSYLSPSDRKNDFDNTKVRELIKSHRESKLNKGE